MSEHVGVHKWACFFPHPDFYINKSIFQFAGKLGIVHKRGHSKDISTHDKQS